MGELHDETSGVRADERVVLFRSFAGETESGDWELPVQGWIFEPEEDSLRRRVGLGLLRRALGLRKGQDATTSFLRRVRAFVVDNERWRHVTIGVEERNRERGADPPVALSANRLGPSRPDGHFHGSLQLTREIFERALDETSLTISFRALLPHEDRRVFRGLASRVPLRGISVVSDIDDTLKESGVHDTRTLLTNTFLRSYEPVEGMRDLLDVFRTRDNAFHYVSGSPWQLYEPLLEAFDRHTLPFGSFHLRRFRLKDRSALRFLHSPIRHKITTISALFARFPRRRFVLLGDTGEQDPEVYATLAARHPGSVRKIFLRQPRAAVAAHEESADTARLAATFSALPRSLWRVFRDPGEVLDDAREVAALD